MIRLREKVCLFEPEVYSAIERERAAFNEGHDATLGFDIYLNALLQTALERERQAREALAEAKRLADEANTTKVSNMAAVDEVLSKMAPAVERVPVG